MGRKETVRAVSQIRRLYDAGVPFLTKEAIYKVQQQLKDICPGEVIFIKGLNGEIESLKSLEGRTKENQPEGCPPDMEWVYDAPHICYQTIQWLTRTDIPGSFLNLRLAHYSALRNKSTGEIGGRDPTLPLKEVGGFFQASQEAWRETEQFELLKGILMLQKTPSRITKIIGFGCGSIKLPGDDNPPPHRSAFQHALVFSLREILEDKAKTPEKIECYVQDPIYTTIDKAVLEESEVEVLDDPEAFLKADDSSVAFSCSPNVPVKQIVCDIARPAIMIWDRVRSRDPPVDRNGRPVFMTDPDSPRVWELVGNMYDEIRFPEYKEHFGNLSIYIRRENS